MDGKTQLGDFLQARHNQLRPEDVGVPTHGERRRAPGLRREQLALLAGVSASYYTRLEQGQSLSASPEVLNAIATALRLDESERRYLHDLARADRQRGRRSAPERVTEAMHQLLNVLVDVPAIVLGRRSDVLAWNRLGHALFAGHLDPGAPDLPAQRPNMARLVFLDSHVRDLCVEWPSRARAVVGNLRAVVAQHPEDVAPHALLGELSAKSTEFASMWADRRIKGLYRRPLRYAPSAGRAPDGHSAEPEQRAGPSVVVATTEPGSPSRSALALLAQVTGEATTQARLSSDPAQTRPRAHKT